MKKSRFSESQIVAILKEVELGAKVGETCRKHGISEPTYYKWKNQYSGMTVPHLAQLRELQEENARLKRMYADLALMHSALKCIDPLNSCTGVIVEGNDDEYPDGRRYQALDGQA